MEPSEFFNKKVIGRLVTRKIKSLGLRASELEQHTQASIDQHKIYDVIDILEGARYNGKIYICNKWDNEEERAVVSVHESFVESYTDKLEELKDG